MGADNNGGSFYFYNPVTVEFGKKEFQARWGKRPLADDWRLGSKNANDSNNTDNDDIDVGQKDSVGEKEINP